MAEYRLSRHARIDLKEIASYSYDNFGLEKADAYLADLYAAFARLTQYPETVSIFSRQGQTSFGSLSAPMPSITSAKPMTYGFREFCTRCRIPCATFNSSLRAPA